MKRLKVGYLMDPVRTIHPEYDTSFALMKECARRRHEVYACELKDLRKHHNTVQAWLTKYRPDERRGLIALDNGRWMPLSRLDALFIRKDPPFDMSYVSAMMLLQEIGGGAKQKPFMINDPSGILNTNEKISAMEFPSFCPPGLTASTYEAFEDFLKKPSTLGWVFKPLFFKGGRGITWVRPSERSRIRGVVARLTRGGREPIVCQHYIDHAAGGDKRILILNGRPLGAMRRIAKKGEFRANLSKGAIAAAAHITPREMAMVQKLRPTLKARGLYFVGIDVLSGYLSEINVTSPSGAPEINTFNGGRVESAVIDFIEKRAAKFR